MSSQWQAQRFYLPLSKGLCSFTFYRTQGKGSMVTWWLIGQERRDSLTGINMIKSEGSLPSRSSLPKRDSIPSAKSEGSLQSQKNSLAREMQDVTVVAKTSEGSASSRGQSCYSKIVSFNGHHQNSSSSQEQLDHNLPLPGTVVTDNEPLLL